MFYRTAEGAPLPHSPFAALIAPRPIAWISTRCSTGDNLAPFSFFNALAYRPPQIMVAPEACDTLEAIRETRVFAVNLVTRALLNQMNATSAPFPRGTDEFAACGVAKADCETIACPRVAEAPATLECVATQFVPIDSAEGEGHVVIVARVEAIHIRDELIRDGRYDLALARPMARLGYHDYAEVTDLIELKRPR